MLLDAGGTFWTQHFVVMVWFPRELIDVAMGCAQTKRVSKIGTKRTLHRGHGTNDISLESRARSEGDAAFEKVLEDPIEGRPATGNSVAGIVNLFVYDLFGTGGTEMEQRCPSWTQKTDFQVGSEDWNDVLFTGQRIRWMKDLALGSSIEVRQERAIASS